MRSFTTTSATAALLALALAACSNDVSAPTQPTFAAARDDGRAAGAVYTISNGAASNEVLAFRRAADGSLTPIGAFATGGRGIGGGVDPLASQYAVILNEGHSLLYVVNAGSNEVSSFRVGDDGVPTLADRESSGGATPVSLAAHDRLLYVLNSGDNTLHGFRAAASGELAPLPHSDRALSPGTAGAAAIRFSTDGRSLIVTERGSNRIESFAVEPDGRLGAATATASSGAAPFGFDVAPGGRVIVSEAANGTVSSYRTAGGALAPVTSALSTQGRATCWLLATHDGRFAYGINAGTATITGLAVDPSGALSLLNANGVTGSAEGMSAPIDPAFSSGDAYLYVLEGRAGRIFTFQVGADHGLTPQGSVPVGVLNGLQGLAAY